jgi:isoquinoline 1-oxidoreductase beta subunit
VNNPNGDQSNGTLDRPERKWTISRRGFLIGMAATGTALALGIPLGLPVARRKVAGLTEGDLRMSFGSLDPLVWFEVSPDDRVRLFLTKAELGQGVHTSLAQIAAEELEISWEQLEVVHASTARGDSRYRGTSGSTSVASLYDPLRQAAATLREMLRTQAASHLDQPAERLVAREGGFEIKEDPDTRVSYGALVMGAVDWQVPEEDVPLKPASRFKFIGQSIPRVDLPAKVTGQAIYGYDARAEGMLYGAVAHPPAFGARMLSARPGQAASMPGVVKVVIADEDGFAGVVAQSRIQAAAARDGLEIEWDEGQSWQQAELEEIVTAGGPGGVNIQREGDAPSILARGTPLTAEYRIGFGAHACLETQAALADVDASGGRVWISTQFEQNARTSAARAIGVEPEQVEVIPTYVGGGFGRKIGLGLVSSVAAEAARLSKAVGTPVHVSWDRAEETRCGFFRPLTHHRLAATLDGNGRIEALALQQASGDGLFGLLPEFAARVIGFDLGAVRGVLMPYAIPNREVTAWRHRLPIPTGTWRGVGLFPNIFPLESFIDELAHAAGADPLQFRLDHLPDDARGQRLRAVLEAAADRSGWGMAPPEGRARGIACCIDAGTVVAEVAEVSLDQAAGQVRVHRVVAAMDCGRTINPDGATAQVEGAITMGVSAALVEEITVKDGRVEAGNFDRYPLLRLRDAPDVETILLESPGGRPGGVGEPAIGPIAPAIGNGLFALTGVRLRQLPMTPERVKSALQA